LKKKKATHPIDQKGRVPQRRRAKGRQNHVGAIKRVAASMDPDLDVKFLSRLNP